MTTATEATFTKADEYRREVGGNLAEARRELREAIQRRNYAKGELDDAKELVKAAQVRVNDLSSEFESIEDGRYQPKLAFSKPTSSNGKPASTTDTPVDEGAAMPIESLKEFSLSEKDVEKIANCPCHPKTIGEFEAWQRTDELWTTKIAGLKDAGITRLQDAHMEFRKTYPIPVPGEAKAESLGGDGEDADQDDGEPADTDEDAE